MSTIKRFEEIESWKTARKLTNQIYELSNMGEFSRDFGLRDQIRRASVSIMSNIAEGFESQTQSLFIPFLGRAKASAGEVRSQLYIALDLEYITEEQFQEVYHLVLKCSRQIYGFMKYLKSKPNALRIKEDKIIYNLDQ